ncbi:MAG TPA: isoprenylcysteine carboxylmethyltransferase family protein [Rhizomicrobium sp.]|nr:isoprenylcysteine carboxylmethyltransferase family protein [Rhizomicrobium sp.]
MRRGTKSYDLWAAVPLMIWYGLGAVSHLMSVHAELTKLNFSRPQFVLVTDILSQLAAILFAGMIVALLFARRPATATAAGLGPRVAGILGTYLGVGFLLLPTPHISPWIRDLGTLLILSGVAFSMYALSYLGRSVSLIAEARKLVTGGPYSVVRHPLYLGEEIAILGAVLQYFSVWALLILGLQLLCQLYRMSYEEEVLGSAFPDYSAYKSRTFRLVPGIY